MVNSSGHSTYPAMPMSSLEGVSFGSLFLHSALHTQEVMTRGNC
jgi:hypothetical protein